MEVEFDPTTVKFILDTFKEALRGYKNFEQWLLDGNRKYDPLSKSVSKYSSRLMSRYGFVRIFSMQKPISLKRLLVNVNILEKITANIGSSVEQLEKFFEKDARGFGTIIKTTDGLEVIEEFNQVMVFGKPGAGKTTFLKSLMVKCFEGKLKRKLIPIFISLKDLSDSGFQILDFINQEFDVCGFPDAGGFIERILEKGRCLILFDGFDEITKNQDKNIIALKNFIDKYPDNQVLISCRIAAKDYIFENFVEVEIADFDSEQINTFIDNWFESGSEKAILCKNRIQHKPSYLELATTPLLLALLCLNFDETMEFPSNKSELYKEAIDALLKKWDASRAIKRDEIYEKLSIRRKEDMLSKIAHTTFCEDEYFFKRIRLEDLIENYIEHLTGNEEYTDRPTSQVILKAIVAQHGLFVERAKRIYSFSHLTFQEYFTAKFIRDTEAQGSVSDLVELQMFEKKWNEVLHLTAGMLSNADEFFQQMMNQLKRVTKDSIFINYEHKIFSTVEHYIQTGFFKEMAAYSYQELLIYFDCLIDILDKKQHKTLTQKLDAIRQRLYITIEGFKMKVSDVPSKKLEHEKTAASEYFEKVFYGYSLLESCLYSDCYLKKERREVVRQFIEFSFLGNLLHRLEMENERAFYPKYYIR